MRVRWHRSIKEKAKLLRGQGYSYGQLATELKVSKSTLHAWIYGIKRPTHFTNLDRIRWTKEIQPLGAQANKRKKEKMVESIIREAEEEVSKLECNKDLKKAMLSIVYWAEGSKGRGALDFTNTDPKLMVLFVTMLRECYTLDESKFRIRLHLHYYHKAREVKTFWSNLLKIPTTQFGKIYRKSRSKEKTFRRNFGGVCTVRYNSTYLQDQVIQYGYALGEKITSKLDKHP